MAIPANLVLLVVSQFIYVVGWTFVHLLYHDSQRGEYLADRLAGDVAGRSAAVSMLEKLHLGDEFGRQVTGLAINDQRDLLGEWRAATAALASQDRERATAAARSDVARLDATHPPTGGRIRLLEARPQGIASVVVSASQQMRIDAELAQHERRVHAELADKAASALYDG
jgi:Zn-dependent protease with chaperone function